MKNISNLNFLLIHPRDSIILKFQIHYKIG